jgi:hypothetical protein
VYIISVLFNLPIWSEGPTGPAVNDAVKAIRNVLGSQHFTIRLGEERKERGRERKGGEEGRGER